MSSKPSKEGVEKVREALRDWRFLSKRVVELRKAVEELPRIEEEARAKHAEIITLLDGMDVAANGNFGWEGRVLWFLNELDTQAGNYPSL